MEDYKKKYWNKWHDHYWNWNWWHKNWCWWHDCHDDHHDHHDDHHDTHTSTSGHKGDLTVVVDITKYHAKDNALHHVILDIGKVYSKELDLSKHPEHIKVTNLDINKGKDFTVCLANKDTKEGECTVKKYYNNLVHVNLAVN